MIKPQPELMKFTNPTGRAVRLVVGTGNNIADQVFECEPEGVMVGPVNYAGFFGRNGLKPITDEEIAMAKQRKLMEAKAQAEAEAAAKAEAEAAAKKGK